MCAATANGVASSARLLQQARDFWQSERGKAMWQCQRACVGPLVEALPGQHGLEFTAAAPLLPLSNLRHQVQWVPSASYAHSSSSLLCDPAQLALPDESMSLVIIHHLLDILHEPHYLLSEAARVTDDNGKLIILGWHPMGPGRLSRIGPSRHKRFPHQLAWRSTSQLRDWLAFVDFEIERVDYCAYSVSRYRPRWESCWRRYNLPFAHTYVITAKRRLERVIPIGRRRWQPLALPARSAGLGACRNRLAPGSRRSSSKIVSDHSR